jgi:hypothetical protein
MIKKKKKEVTIYNIIYYNNPKIKSTLIKYLLITIYKIFYFYIRFLYNFFFKYIFFFFLNII